MSLLRFLYNLVGRECVLSRYGSLGSSFVNSYSVDVIIFVLQVNMIPGYDGEIADEEMCIRVANDIGYVSFIILRCLFRP